MNVVVDVHVGVESGSSVGDSSSNPTACCYRRSK